MTEEKGIQLSPTQRLSTDYKLYELTKFVEKDDYWWKELGQRATPFKYIPQVVDKLESLTRYLSTKIGSRTTYQMIFTDKLQITKVPMSPSGNSQHYVNPKCYALTLRWALWNILESLVNESITSTISVEEYLALVDSKISFMQGVDILDKIVVKEKEEVADN